MAVERQNNQENLIGASCNEAIKEIIRLNPQISKLRFRTYYYVPLAIKEVKEPVCFFLTTKEFKEGEKLQERIKNLQEGWDIGIVSRVILKDGSEAHIPMIDFKLSKNQENLQKIKKALKETLNEKEGYILETEVSYHYYGANLLKGDKGWRNFMAKCLLTSIVHSRENIEEVVDSRYIGHKLLEGESCLRLSNNTTHKFIPKIVDFL